jgi:TolB protein
MLARSRRKRISPLTIATMLGILTLLFVLGTPRLTDREPAAGSTSVPSTAGIHLTFNLPMDRTSVEAKLTIQPEIEGQYQWAGRSLSFLPEVKWPKGERVTICLDAGARSIYFLPLIKKSCWSFDIGFPRLLYLAETNGKVELHSRGIQDGQEQILTETTYGVLDYSISLAGTSIVYTATREDGSSDLRLLDLVASEDRLLLACPQGWLCQRPHLSPDFQFVAYERAALEQGTGGKSLVGSAQIWVAPIGEGGEPALVSEAGHACESPLWSVSGYLAYTDLTSKRIILLRHRSGLVFEEALSAANELGATGAWSPEGAFLLFPDLVIAEATYEKNEATGDEFPLYYSHLFLMNVSTGLVSDLSSGDLGFTEDASPAFSPNGQWIAFARKHLEIEQWTPGRQVWMMRTDGTDAKQITDDPEFSHFDLSWSPDSKYLAFVRSNQSDLLQPLEIWLYDFDHDETMPFLVGGYQPQWLP